MKRSRERLSGPKVGRHGSEFQNLCNFQEISSFVQAIGSADAMYVLNTQGLFSNAVVTSMVAQCGRILRNYGPRTLFFKNFHGALFLVQQLAFLACRQISLYKPFARKPWLTVCRALSGFILRLRAAAAYSNGILF